MLKTALIAIAFMTLAGCASFESIRQYPDGRIDTVRENGAFLLSRKGNFRITEQWLGPDNVLHESGIEWFAEENTSDQLKGLQIMFEAGHAVGLAGDGMPCR